MNSERIIYCKNHFRRHVVEQLAEIRKENAELRALLLPAPGLLFKFGPISEFEGPVTKTPQYQNSFKGEVIAMFELRDTQKLPLSVAAKDKHGHPAEVENLEWFVDNSEVLALDETADGVEVTPVGPLGTATVSVKCDADLGEGVKQLSGSLEISVVAGEAVTVDITPGTPVDVE